MASTGNWKDRFTKEQLERKRATDRANHRKTRQRTKEATNELEHRLRLALQGDHATLINRLLDENARLQARLDFYQSRLEGIVQASQECLDSDDGFVTPPKAASGSGTIASHQQPSPSAGLNSPLIAFQYIPASSSFIHEIFSFAPLNIPSHASSILPPADVINSVMNWKMFSERGNTGLSFVIQNLSMTSIPSFLSLDDLEIAVLSNTTFQNVLERLLYDGPEFSKRPRDSDSVPEGTVPPMSEMERQRRAAAICACENTQRWRNCYRSEKEYVALFWAQYRYFLFLIFPTMENYTRCLPWHRPRLAQFTSSHPGFVDFLIWPKLREHLVENWQEYNAEELILSHVRNFEICAAVEGGRPLIKLKADMSDIEIDESFERVIRNMDNLATHEDFCVQFPELKYLVNAKAWKHHEGGQSETTPIGDALDPRLLKRNLPSCFYEDASTQSKRVSISRMGMADNLNGNLDPALYPFETAFYNRELAAMTSITSMDLSNFAQYQIQVPSTRAERHKNRTEGSDESEAQLPA